MHVEGNAKERITVRGQTVEARRFSMTGDSKLVRQRVVR